jgi:hypothetical protein
MNRSVYKKEYIDKIQFSNLSFADYMGHLTIDRTLPKYCHVGAKFYYTGDKTNIGKLKQNPEQIIHSGEVSTTRGISGSLANIWIVELMCVIEDKEFVITRGQGNWTIV